MSFSFSGRFKTARAAREHIARATLPEPVRALLFDGVLGTEKASEKADGIDITAAGHWSGRDDSYAYQAADVKIVPIILSD